MIYNKITINNFKGIKNIELNLENNRIITLVGLNESGKTTIMEAIKFFHLTITGHEISEVWNLHKYLAKIWIYFVKIYSNVGILF